MDVIHWVGIVVGIYTLRAIAVGYVHAKQAASLHWRIVYRDESPIYYWVIIGIYTGLSIMVWFVPTSQ